MKIDRISLLKRLSHIRDEEAARRLGQQQQRLAQAQAQADLLDDYRRNLSPGANLGECVNATLLRSRATFSEVAAQASTQAHHETTDIRKAVDEALASWQTTRETARVIDDQHAATLKQQARTANRKADEANQESSKRPSWQSGP